MTFLTSTGFVVRKYDARLRSATHSVDSVPAWLEELLLKNGARQVPMCICD